MTRVLIEDLIYHYGDSFDDLIVVWQDASGVPISLSGYTATMRIRTAPATTGTFLLELTSAVSGGLTIDAPNGKITFAATPTKMKSGSLVQSQSYFYDLQVSNGSETKTLLKGKFWVDPEVTDV